MAGEQQATQVAALALGPAAVAPPRSGERERGRAEDLRSNTANLSQFETRTDPKGGLIAAICEAARVPRLLYDVQLAGWSAEELVELLATVRREPWPRLQDQRVVLLDGLMRAQLKLARAAAGQGMLPRPDERMSPPVVVIAWACQLDQAEVERIAAGWSFPMLDELRWRVLARSWLKVARPDRLDRLRQLAAKLAGAA